MLHPFLLTRPLRQLGTLTLASPLPTAADSWTSQSILVSRVHFAGCIHGSGAVDIDAAGTTAVAAVAAVVVPIGGRSYRGSPRLPVRTFVRSLVIHHARQATRQQQSVNQSSDGMIDRWRRIREPSRPSHREPVCT